jgi:hypothetical protein
MPRSATPPAALDTDPHLARLRRVSRVMDDAVSVPGTRFGVGLDGVLGLLLPGVGDAIGATANGYALYAGYRMGAPPLVLVRMALWALADLLLGAVPLLGDVLDFFLKSNRRSLRLLEAWAASPERVARRSKGVLAAVAFGLIALIVGVCTLVVWGIASIVGALPTVGDWSF